VCGGDGVQIMLVLRERGKRHELGRQLQQSFGGTVRCAWEFGGGEGCWMAVGRCAEPRLQLAQPPMVASGSGGGRSGSGGGKACEAAIDFRASVRVFAGYEMTR
jgi:hypothetical protein